MVLTEEERKERHRNSMKKYRESQKGKKYQETYSKSEKGKAKLKEQQKTEKYKEYKKEYRLSIGYKNSQKEYNNSEKGKKTRRKTSWKSRGVNMENFEELYTRYNNAIFCDICECVLNVEGDSNTIKCLDHDHDTGDFRNIVCNYCNLYICK